ncbi:hypothetical protein JOM56_009137, partial [Amanita muscaria]
MGRILDRTFSVPLFRIRKEGESFGFRYKKPIDNSMRQWRAMSKSSSVTRIKAMLAVAKAFQYFHSLGIVLDHHQLSLECIFLDSKFCAKIQFQGMLSDLEERWTFKTNIFSFGCFFYETYFNVGIEIYDSEEFNRNLVSYRRSKIRDDAWQLIQRCCAEYPKSRPTIDEVVQEMESWKL